MTKGVRSSSFRMTLGITNAIVLILLAVGVIILVRGSTMTELTLRASASPVLDVSALLLLPVILAFILAIASKADRRCSDDYAYQLLATSAMIGMFTMIGANTVWALDFVRDGIGIRDLRGPDMMAIGMIGWAASYFTFLARGLK